MSAAHVKQYADRDSMAMDMAGNYYCRHVNAMTVEGLHAKSDIAGELAWRDMEIDRLVAALAKANSGFEEFERKWYLEQEARETAEAALLAKSAAYDALVARVEAAPVGQVRGAAVNASNEILEVALFGDRNQVPLLSRVRLLVSDDRPSHTAGEK